MPLIAHNDTVAVTPPNLPPEWTSTPVIQVFAGVGGSGTFNDNTFDPEGDTLSYAINAGSTAFPAWFSVASNGTWTATAAATQGETTGIIIDVDDGVNAAVASPSFSIVVSSWLGQGLSGELGCLAVNDSHASTVYEEGPQYAPTVPTIPTPTGSPASTGSSRVNPNSSDEYLVEDSAGWTTALSGLSSGTYSRIFVAKGVNASSESLATVTGAGTEGSPKWVVYWDTDTPSNVQDIKPWNLTFANRATVGPVRQEGNYVHYVGLSWGNNGSISPTVGALSFQNGATGCIGYRLHGESHNAGHNFRCRTSATDCYFFECVARDSNRAIPTAADCHGFLFNSATRCRVISCEAYDLQGDCFQAENGTIVDSIIEDNDFYRTSATYYDGSGNQDNSGNYGNGEVGITFKDIDKSSTEAIVEGNRLWGFRQHDPVATTGSTFAGYAIGFSTPATSRRYVRMLGNIIDDVTTQYAIFLQGESSIPNSSNHSVVFNLIADHDWVDGIGRSIRVSHDDCEVYLNTLIRTDGIGDFFANGSGLVQNLDWMGNLQISAGGWASTSNLDTNCKVGYGGFVDSTTYETGFSGTNVTESSFSGGNFTYRRKKLTSPETATITGCVPTTSSPSSLRTGAPGSGDTDPIGARTEIGVDDVVVSTWP